MERYRKVDVEVTAHFSKGGGMKPLSIVWEDGREFFIDKVKADGFAPARVGALLPQRFTCIIRGQKKWLYFEPKTLNWFVEVPNV